MTGTNQPQRRRLGLGRWAPAYALAGVPLALIAPPDGQGWTLLAFNAALACLVWIDGRRAARCALHVERALPGRLAAGQTEVVELRLRNTSGRPLRLRVRDDAPVSCAVEPAEHALELAPHAHASLRYRLTPTKRGPQAFGDIHVRCELRAGLGSATLRFEAGCEVRVVPASVLTGRRGLPGPSRQAGEVKVRRRHRQRGRGELEMLREFVTGDELRDVDWKATARRNRPITRVYQQERSQYVWLVLDVSRAMATEIARRPLGAPDRRWEEGPEQLIRTKLDAGLDAALKLGHQALAAGDQVGALAYADEAVSVVPPGRGAAHYRRLLEALYGMQARRTHLNLRGLVSALEHHVRRRALLVLFTDLDEENHVGPLAEHLPILRRRHLPVCVSLDDKRTAELADSPSELPAQVYERAAAADVLHDREQLRARLTKRGLAVIEASDAGLPQAAMAKYLEVKAQQRL